jgi:hypothetical protein
MPTSSIDQGDPIAADKAHGEPPRGGHGLRKIVDNRWVVLATLFFVTAALGLPVLWASRGFSGRAKVALTVVVLAYTALILWLFYLLMASLVPPIIEAWRGL